MVWRAERRDAGADVGPLPEHLADYEVIRPPAQPPIVPITAQDKRPEPPIGIPIVTPF